MITVRRKQIALIILCFLLFGIFTGKLFISRAQANKTRFPYDYGVFLSVGPESIPRMQKYRTIVIDVQNDFTKKEISKLKKQGHIVYSYINVGSVEQYRDYYKDYEDITLGVYENWPDERWVDVSNDKWQSFILNELSVKLKKTGIDGFFVDNADVYYYYNNAEIFDGLTQILKGLKKQGKVIINGGDEYVSTYLRENGNLDAILNGVNQESVFTKILDYENNEFTRNDRDTEKYFRKYIRTVKKDKKEVYLLEYTTDKKLKKKIKKYCKRKGYSYYISGSLDLS